MPELADIFKTHGSRYLAKYQARMLPSHLRAFSDILFCRSESMGWHVKKCSECGYTHYYYHSCCNRSCPKCHGQKIKDWFESRKAELLPVPYFHVVFTVPSQLRRVIRSNHKLQSILIKSAAYSLKVLAKDPRYVGGNIAVFCALHTWTRMMIYHPHVHCLVPGGGLSLDHRYWLPSKKSFFLPIRALSKIFRAKFVSLVRKEIPEVELPQSIWEKPWVVFSKPTISGAEKVLEYLSRYIHRIAITNNRIISDRNGKVTFKYKDSKDNKWKFITLDAMEFIRRFLQHVCYKGFHKVRYYGLLSPKNLHLINKIRNFLITKNRKMTFSDPRKVKKNQPSQKKKISKCPECESGDMIFVMNHFSPRVYLNGRSPPW